MGCSCSTATDPKSSPIQQALADPSRYCAYSLPTSTPDHALIYDFQTRESRVIRLTMNPPLIDYTVYINHPLLFVAGGAERATNELSNRLWLTSAGEDVVDMSGCKYMSEARRKPFMVSPKEGTIYIIGGLKHNHEFSKGCEKFNIGEDAVFVLKPMNGEHDTIVSVGKYVYGLGKYGSRDALEVLDSSDESKGWEIRMMRGSESPINWLQDFGVVGMDDLGENLIIFGGKTRDSMLTTGTFSLNGNTGRVEPLRRGLPMPEGFLLPTTTGKSIGFAISQSFKLYTYNKKVGEWNEHFTGIIAQIEKKRLHLN